MIKPKLPMKDYLNAMRYLKEEGSAGLSGKWIKCLFENRY